MSEVFARLNDAFRPAYDDLRARALAAQRPILFATGDQIVLLRDGGRVEARLDIPREVDELKAVAHLVLTCFLVLGTRGDHALDGPTRDCAHDLRVRVRAAADAPPAPGLDPAAVDRQRELLDRAAALLDRALAAGRADAREAAAFVRACRPLVDAQTADAAARMLAVLRAGIEPLWESLSPAERDRLVVLNMGTKSAREGAQIARYLAWLMGVEGEGERLVFAEGARDEAEAMQVLATFLADLRIGVAFGDHPLAFLRDVLGEPTDALLRGLTSPHPP
jgi:hypothetical protein